MHKNRCMSCFGSSFHCFCLTYTHLIKGYSTKKYLLIKMLIWFKVVLINQKTVLDSTIIPSQRRFLECGSVFILQFCGCIIFYFSVCNRPSLRVGHAWKTLFSLTSSTHVMSLIKCCRLMFLFCWYLVLVTEYNIWPEYFIFTSFMS